MFEKIKFALKNVNYFKAGLWSILWIALVTFIIYVTRANDYVGHTDSGNVVIFPSYFQCIKLFLKLDHTWIWGVVSIILSGIAGLTFELLIESFVGADAYSIGTLLLSLVFSILVLYIGVDSRNIDEMTHHTMPKTEYDSVSAKNSHLDYYFHDAFQADSLYGK